MIIAEPLFYLALRQESRKHLCLGGTHLEFPEIDLTIVKFLYSILILDQPHHQGVAVHVNISHFSFLFS